MFRFAPNRIMQGNYRIMNKIAKNNKIYVHMHLKTLQNAINCELMTPCTKEHEK
jgi:hypothetical protein